MLGRVVLLFAVGAGCGHTAEPAVPARGAAAQAAGSLIDAPPAGRAGTRYLVGETCVNAALGEPHVFPLFAGGDIAWTADESLARGPMTAGPQRFDVLGVDGEVHGNFVTAVDGAPSDRRGFVGVLHFGREVGPCNYLRPDGMRVTRVDCGTAGGCGISVAISGETAPPPAPPTITVAQVCVVDGSLIADLDGDSADEAFPLESFRTKAAVEGARATGPRCPTPRFAWYGMPVGTDVIDVLGALDLDRDGHLELLIAYTPAGGPRTVTLYTPAPGPAHRLDWRAASMR